MSPWVVIFVKAVQIKDYIIKHYIIEDMKLCTELSQNIAHIFKRNKIRTYSMTLGCSLKLLKQKCLELWEFTQKVQYKVGDVAIS